MDFPRKSNTYTVTYTKRQANNYFKKYDKRVDLLVTERDKIIITTIDVLPNYTKELKDFFGDNINKVGKYIIEIKKIPYCGRKILNILIKHQNGFIHKYYEHEHIGSELYSSTICWGNVCSSISRICDHFDWYYAIKYCLDLVYDFHIDDNLGTKNYKIPAALMLRNLKLKNKQDEFNKLFTLMNDKYGGGWDNEYYINKQSE